MDQPTPLKDAKHWEALLGRLNCFNIMLKNEMPPAVAKETNSPGDEGKIAACFEHAHEVGMVVLGVCTCRWELQQIQRQETPAVRCSVYLPGVMYVYMYTNIQQYRPAIENSTPMHLASSE